MHELDDQTLLRQYAEQNSEAAFAALVARHVDKVYSTALRHTRNTHAAEEITQAVFVILTRKARSLRKHTALSGWLYETARLTALTYIRSEIRRMHREQEAYMQTALNENIADAWPHIAPLLDDALAGLSAADRHAIVLRYFDGKSLNEVGESLGASEDAAKKRVTRAVEKLRGWFTKRGVTLTATVLTAAISANSVQAAPLGLAATVTATAAKGAAVSGSTLTLIKGALKIMAWTKMKTAVVIGAGVLLVAGSASIAVNRSDSLNKPGIDAYISDTNLEDYKKAPALVAIQPTHFPIYYGILGHSMPDALPNSIELDGGALVGRNQTLKELIGVAYDFRAPRIIFPASLPTNHYDFLITMPTNRHAIFQSEIERMLGYSAHIETRDTNVQVLKVAAPIMGKPKAGKVDAPEVRFDRVKGPLGPAFNYPDNQVSDLARALEYRFRMPVIDQTGLTGKFYMVFDWRWKGDWRGKDRAANLASLKETILNQLGLELISTNMPVELLVVEKVK